MRTVQVEIKKDAKVVVSVDGCTGPECQKLTEGIESAIGSTTSSTPTPEMYQENEQSEGMVG